jgi:YVTN family beta-propeller protein
VSVISVSNRTVVATISVGSHPTALAYDSGRSEVFVVNRDDNTVSVVLDCTYTVDVTIPVGKTPYGVAIYSGGKVYVINYAS